ncbi:hypothetical protein H9Y04_06050 [Streptomyces sp. TRM66268-LWL]|uniref:Uncharacterized protein n=1 Tax=Streptomyces polyasparticus TaxID=2767826 RepID=A0ABR7S9H4_9ACTN|nr:hypothetical protein [Streptomyces polyasparticus]MBC9712131.1 hypothetical protein [Streptomyces polyasparticus]
MSGDGKDLKAQGLGLIAQGLTAALDELKELGMVGTAGAGRGFGDIALSGLELGHEGLTTDFGSFCERWEWGVRSLINEGNSFAQKTGLSAGTYYETDQYVEGSLKVATNSLIGNPYATEDEVTRQNWGDVATSGIFGGDVDYSKESFDTAFANAGQGWKDAGRDVATSDFLGTSRAQDLAGMTDAEYEAQLDETFGPSAEERAKAAEQGGGAG